MVEKFPRVQKEVQRQLARSGLAQFQVVRKLDVVRQKEE